MRRRCEQIGARENSARVQRCQMGLATPLTSGLGSGTTPLTGGSGRGATSLMGIFDGSSTVPPGGGVWDWLDSDTESVEDPVANGGVNDGTFPIVVSEALDPHRTSSDRNLLGNGLPDIPVPGKDRKEYCDAGRLLRELDDDDPTTTASGKDRKEYCDAG